MSVIIHTSKYRPYVDARLENGRRIYAWGACRDENEYHSVRIEGHSRLELAAGIRAYFYARKLNQQHRRR